MRSLDCTNSNIKKFIVVNESKGRASCWVTEKDKPVELHYDLENINCSYNSIKAISWLPFLKFLICNNNKIRKIDSMKSLKECDIRSNRLKKIPFINEKFMYEFSEDKIKDYSYNYNVHNNTKNKFLCRMLTPHIRSYHRINPTFNPEVGPLIIRDKPQVQDKTSCIIT
jgi:Leucine-rich repeat (LRR) protein